MKPLQQKIAEIEDEHYDELVKNKFDEHEKAKFGEAMRVFGGIRAVDRLVENISGQVISALSQFQEEKLYRYLGYQNFVDFLNSNDFSLMTKSEFYRQKELLEAEGLEKYDLFNEAKIPLSTRRLLAKHNGADVILDGDKIIYGEMEISSTDKSEIKELIKSIAADLRNSNQINEKKEKQIEKLKSQVENGQAEYDQLRRSVDSANDGTPYTLALMKVVGAMIALTGEAKKLSPLEIQERDGDVEVLWRQMLLVRAALRQTNFVFTEEAAPAKPMTDIERWTKQIVAEDSDFGDEYEQ